MMVSTVNQPRVGLLCTGCWESASVVIATKNIDRNSVGRNKVFMAGAIEKVSSENGCGEKVKKTASGFNVFEAGASPAELQLGQKSHPC